MRRAIAMLLIISISMMNVGCSLFMPQDQTITVTASERDAEIFINGNLSGRGTAQEVVRRNQNVAVMVKKDGFYPTTRHISKTMSSTGIVDIIGGCIWLVPFFGLLAPGAWELQKTNLTVEMEKEK